MSIIHEALKKATRDEAPAPPLEKKRKLRFSAAAFPFSRLLFQAVLFFVVVGIAYFVYQERGAVSSLIAHKKTVALPGPLMSDSHPMPSVAPPAPALSSNGPSRAASTGQRGKDSVDSHQQMGVNYYKQGKFAEAEREFLLAAALNPESSQIQNNLGLVLKTQGRDGEAESRYREALRINPANVQSMNNLGLLYEQQNRLEEARGLYQKAVAIQPDFPDAHLNYAVLLERAGYFEEAKRHYRSFLTFATPRHNQAVVLVKKHLDRLP